MLEFVERRRRYTPAQLRELGELHEPSSHVNRIPEPSQYHGWASGSLGDGEGLDPDILSLARSPAAPQQDHSHHPLFRMPRTNSGSSRDSRIPQLSQASSSESLDFRSPEVNGPTFVSESSLHAAALLQSSRRNSLQHARSRSQVQTYIPSRDRSSHDGDDAERSSSTRLARGSYNFAPPSQQLQAQQRQQQQLNARSQQLAFYQMQQTNQLNYQRRFHQDQLGIHQRQMIANQRDWVQTQEANQARSTQLPVETYRQRYLENPSTTPPNPTRSLDDAIKYLERLRFCESVQDSLLSAKAGGFGQDELSSNADFILDIADIEPPPESSWLKFGAILSGSQHAANPSALPSYRALPQATNPSTVTSRASQSPVFIPQGQISGPLRAEQISRPSGANPTSLANLDVDEQWPVKVTIHSTDYATMTISGTMEAFNVPDKSSPTHESSITTFLEGEIIDFNKFTLETKSYNANSRIDGTYWRKLEPFKKLTDDEIVRALLSKKWLTEELSKKWILMRWKGISMCPNCQFKSSAYFDW